MMEQTQKIEVHYRNGNVEYDMPLRTPVRAEDVASPLDYLDDTTRVLKVVVSG